MTRMYEPSSLRRTPIVAETLPRLQKFFEDNPEYHLAVDGRRPRPEEAREEFESLPPAEMPFEKMWLFDYSAADGEMIGMASVISNLLGKGVWHVGLFIVATSLRGRGVAQAVYGDLEAWMREGGARWLRLGVVEGNVRAERFWTRLGYVEVRRRFDVAMGERVNNLRVMVKPLGTATIHEYVTLVPRDRPETP
jgi:ribosomal protein S18 acetylase RimI-like enzyme